MTAMGDVRRQRIDELAARAGQVPEGEGGVSLVRSAFRRLRRNPVAILGAVIVVVFLFVAAFAPWLAPRDPLAQTLLSEVRPGFIPGAQEGFPLGADQLGRDLLSRLIYGSRQSLLIGVVSTVLGAVVGMALGVLAGAFGGWVDTVVMRFIDIVLSIPSPLMAVSIPGLLGQNQYALMIAISRLGRDSGMSMTRGAPVTTEPPKAPHSTPRAIPTTAPSTVETTPVGSDCREP